MTSEEDGVDSVNRRREKGRHVSKSWRALVPRLAVWTLPAISVSLAVGSQFLVPRVLQHGLSEADYTSYVALSSVAAYVGFGEGGVLLSMLRELSALHGGGEQAAFIAELRRSRRIFFVAALLGGAIAAVAFTVGIVAQQGALSAAHARTLAPAAIALVIGAMLELFFGSYHAVLLFSTGRLVMAQLVGLAIIVLPLAGLIAALELSHNVIVGVCAQGMTTALLACARGLHARKLTRAESSSVGTLPPPAPLGRVVGPGAVIKIADVMHAASYPHLLSELAPATVPGAIPARTYSNATRMVTQQFVGLLQVHITRGMAGDDRAKERARSQYRASAMFLTAAHLVQLAMVSALAGFVFHFWLPNQAPYLGELLPGMLASQALLAASLPTDILFIATGHLRTLGVARLVGTALGLVTVAIAIPYFGRGALGVGLAGAGVPLFAAGLWGELSWMRGMAPPSRHVLARYGMALVAAGACAFYGSHPIAAALVTGACGLAALPYSAIRLLRLLRHAPMSDPPVSQPASG